MSADVPSAFPAYKGETLDALLIDPVIRKLFDEVIEKNRADGGMTADAAAESVSEYDIRWSRDLDLMAETARISGTVQYFIPPSIDTPAEYVRVRVEDTEMKSEGFKVLQVLDSGLDDPRYRLVLQLREIHTDDEGNITGQSPVVMELDEIESIFFEDCISLQQSEAILDYYVPGIRSEIEGLILGADTEIEAVYALASTSWEVGELGGDANLIEQALRVYMQKSLEFDELAYTINPFDAEVLVLTDERVFRPANIEVTVESLATVLRVVYMNPCVDGEAIGGVLVPHLDCTIHNEERHNASVRMLIPLPLVTALDSERRRFYERSQE